MLTPSFKPFGWVFLPLNVSAIIITGVLMVAFVHDFIFVDSHAHSVSDTYYYFAPYGFMYVAAWMWIASRSVKP